ADDNQIIVAVRMKRGAMVELGDEEGEEGATEEGATEEGDAPAAEAAAE
ncbi:MAG TPA: 50S ribosomal protein L25, partial [Flavobacteriales bacterium]|nr:50S ribosomal protein L25 [Flavobacteriales bacterium]